MRFAVLAFCLLALSACASIDLGTVGRLRAIDYANDDLGSLLLAFDVPYGLNPVDGGSIVNFDVTTSGGEERHLKAALVRADADDVAGALPPPNAGRVYFLFGFSDKDKKALRDTQAWARTLPPGTGTIAASMAPAFCNAGGIVPDAVRISVLVALPGETALAPLVDNQPLSPMLAGKPLPDC